MRLSLTDVPDRDELRRSASLAAVAAAVGVPLDDQGRALCPFHEDRTPSFSAWIDPAGVPRWGCFPCGKSGDVFDLVQQRTGCSFGAAVRRVVEIMRDPPPTREPAVRPRAALDRAGLEAYVRAARARAAEPQNDGLLCVAASLRGEPDRVLDAMLRALGWGVDDVANVVVPHYGPDRLLTGAKVRALDGQKWSFPGSSFENLYGSWLPPGSTNLVLTEGETDFAVAWAALGVVADVRSLPSGAGSAPRGEWVEQVRGAYTSLYLGLDEDDAGRRSRGAWVDALAGDLALYTLPIPEGGDLRSAGRPPLDLFNDASPVS